MQRPSADLRPVGRFAQRTTREATTNFSMTPENMRSALPSDDIIKSKLNTKLSGVRVRDVQTLEYLRDVIVVKTDQQALIPEDVDMVFDKMEEVARNANADVKELTVITDF